MGQSLLVKMYGGKRNVSSFDSKLVQDKLFLYVIKDRMHSNGDVIQKVLEDSSEGEGI